MGFQKNNIRSRSMKINYFQFDHFLRQFHLRNLRYDINNKIRKFGNFLLVLKNSHFWAFSIKRPLYEGMTGYHDNIFLEPGKLRLQMDTKDPKSGDVPIR